uniref:WD repeat domain phosphoinositide-interacting protein 3 n=1 Tax=Elaeophora elaphi TaxID=1147741 RepID=A0A0R3RXF5_9BILA
MRRASHVLFNTFNQDFGCFVCGLDDGFRIYNTDPLKQNFNEKLNGGIGAVEMLFRCNYVALVGGGVTPAFSTNKVVIWDIINHKEVVQLEMNSDVRAVRLRRDRIVVVLDTSVHIFSFTDQPEKLQVYDSSRNPRGICCLCPASENSLLAFPAPSSSSAVCCITLAEPDAPPRIINAHQRPLSAIALNLTGEQLATSSEKGTIIRIFDTKTCLLLKELRRGTNPASIFWCCINFMSNPLRKLSFSGEVSVSRFRLPFPFKDKDSSICAFGPQPDSVIG